MVSSKPRILVTFPPRDDQERGIVADILGNDAAWLVDGANPKEAQIMLSFWPGKELRKAGLTWTDLPHLQVVKLATAGANHVGWRTLPEDLQVAATPGATGPIIAEYTLAAILEWSRGLRRATADIATGHFDVGAPVRALQENRVGLIGFGGIGQATASLLHRLGVEVEAVNRSGQGPLDHVTHLGTMAELPAMLERVNVAVLCLPLHRETVGLADASFLEQLSKGKDRVLLVNVARGMVVDEEALFAWLQGDLTGRAATIDVWWEYPRDGRGHPYTQPFHTLPNITMTPHNSPNVHGYRLAMLEPACRDLRAHLDGQTLRHIQDREAHLLEREGDGRG